MKAYWDSSAVIEACSSPVLRARLHRERGITRTHTLAEVFSTLTGGNLAFRLDADAAAQTIANLVADSDFHDLTATEILKAMTDAQKRAFAADAFTIFCVQWPPKNPGQKHYSHWIRTILLI